MNNKHQELIEGKVAELLQKQVSFDTEEGKQKFVLSQRIVFELPKILQETIDTVLEEEREEKRSLYQGLQMMFEQYCPNGNHEFMMAGENAETLLEQFYYLRCSCDDSPEHQEFDGHTRYCEALTNKAEERTVSQDYQKEVKKVEDAIAFIKKYRQNPT